MFEYSGLFKVKNKIILNVKENIEALGMYTLLTFVEELLYCFQNRASKSSFKFDQETVLIDSLPFDTLKM